jgi:hypothetical protein
MKFVHRVLSGSPDTSKELVAAGLFVAVWFLMDVVQFADWAIQKFHQPAAAPAQTCEPLAGNSALCIDTSPHVMKEPFPGYYCGSHDCGLPLTQNNSVR